MTSDLTSPLRAHRRAAKKADAAASTLGEAVAREAGQAIGGIWHPDGTPGAWRDVAGAYLWLSLDGDGVWRLGLGRPEWSTNHGEGGDPRAAAYSWLHANTRYRRREVNAVRDWLRERGIHV